MGKREKPQADEPNGQEWLATYADTITLLMTFFVLLYAMSSGEGSPSKAKAVSQAFNVLMMGAEGTSILEYEMYNGNVPLQSGKNSAEIDTNDTNSSSITDAYKDSKENGTIYLDASANGDLEEVTNIDEYLEPVLKEFVEINELANQVDIITGEQGVIMQLKDNVLFESASADLNPNSLIILDKIGELINSINKKVLVEGHTDNRPINTYKYPSNWELSTARAVNVVKYLVTVSKVDPIKLSAAGYGEYRPLVENTTEANMSMNRRVSILILYSDKNKNEGV